MVAHHPWRDRNRRWSRSRASSATSLITPGGIATRETRKVHLPNQSSLITPGGIATGGRRTGQAGRPGASLITPGGIATGRGRPAPRPVPGSLITPGGIATRPDHPAAPRRSSRSSPLEGSQLPAPGGRARGPTESLITPGGIATFGHAVAAARKAPVAHHPWRDRNSLVVRLTTSRRRRSSPLEGSQHGSAGRPGGRVGGRSSPLEGSQQAGRGPAGAAGASLITPGGIATSARAGPPTAEPPVAHHPWRDRNRPNSSYWGR